MPINQRIKEIRQSLGLSQAKFAKNISISNGYIASIELGNRKVNDRLIKLICSAYDVNEAWLRTRTGEMFNSTSDVRLIYIMNVFKNLQPEFQDYVLEQINLLIELQKKTKQDKTLCCTKKC